MVTGATHSHLATKSPAAVRRSCAGCVSPLKIVNEDYACSSQCQALTIAIFPQNEPLITRACLMCPYMRAHYSLLNRELYQCLRRKSHCSYGNAFVNRCCPRGSSPVCGRVFQRERAPCQEWVSVSNPFSSAACRGTASCIWLLGQGPAEPVPGVRGCSAPGVFR